MRAKNALLAAAAATVFLGTAPQHHVALTGSFKVSVRSGPYVSGSRLPLSAAGVEGPVSFSVLGPGHIDGSDFIAPGVSQPASATIIGSAHGAVAMSSITIVPAPAANVPLLAVASYDDGIALHDPRTFRLIGYVPLGGAPGDVAFGPAGSILAPSTDGDTLLSISRAPWQIRATRSVPEGNEIAVDERSGNVFVSNRDAGGFGALTRISPQGTVTRVKTGDTAEGLAIDSQRGLVYVGNVNSNSVAAVDEHSMRVVRTIPSVERTFGIALDRRTQRLFVVSNSSPSMPSGSGFVAAIDLRRNVPRIVLRSARLVFPIGAAIDEQRARLFVTDEVKNAVYVLSTRTLRTSHAPLNTCSTPWRPRVANGRLYIPCANDNEIDVFDLRSLRRIAGAPFKTGGFPLSVAVWP